jgi:hypothetical protein
MKRSDENTYGELIMAAQNSIGNAIDMLEPKKFKNILEDRTIAKDFISLMVSGRHSEDAISLITRFDSKREPLENQLSLILLALRDLIVLQKSEDSPLLFYYDRETAISITDALSQRALFSAYDFVTATLDSISANANVRLSLIKLFSEIGLV